MSRTDTSKVSRWDLHGRAHTVRVQRTGVQRTLRCDTCGWRASARFLPWPKAQEHLTRAHQATVDPSNPNRRVPRVPNARPPVPDH
ncbi:hypothetical protein [Streptomyces sp. SAI-229]|jgi:hypothetical protein|uniref:hypothetical protein n=1 Tax=Streptomyces sp. SAI-229 TaxID=3377731 RepID=UPI003C7BCAD1